MRFRKPSNVVTIIRVSYNTLAHPIVWQTKRERKKKTTWWRSLEQWHFKNLPRWKLCGCDSECVFVAPQIPAASSPHPVWSPMCIHYLSLQRPFETQISCHAESLVVAHAFEDVDDFLWDSAAGWRRTEGGNKSALLEKANAVHERRQLWRKSMQFEKKRPNKVAGGQHAS